MEALLKKLQQKYRKVKEETVRWDELQSRLSSQFRNATAIIERLETIKDGKHYGGLRRVPGIQDSLLAKQLEALELIMCSMRGTLEEFHGVTVSLQKIARDANQLLRGGGGLSPTPQQMEMRIGVRPSVSYCLEGLRSIHEMYRAECLLKSSIVSSLTWKSSAGDVVVLSQVLVDQPNIPSREVQSIFELVFADEMC